jgi:hypothetical protein
MSTSKETDVVGHDVIAPSPAKGQRKILGQTKAAWYSCINRKYLSQITNWVSKIRG